MYVRRMVVPIVAVCAALVHAGPAQAAPTPKRAPSEPLQAQAACLPLCGVAGAVLLVRIATVIRTAAAARTIAVAGRALTPLRKGVRITGQRVFAIRTQAALIARNGARWVMRRWPRLKPYTRACLAGVATLETTRILDDGKMTKDEWLGYLKFADLGNPNPEILNLYFNPALDFSVPRDGWYAACAVGIVGKGVGG
jgi:hypothetical protein